MSYILDALRRTEQERQLGAVPKLGSDHACSGAMGRSRVRWWSAGLIALVAVLVGLIIWFGLLDWAQSGRGPVSVAPVPPVSVPGVVEPAPPVPPTVERGVIRPLHTLHPPPLPPTRQGKAAKPALTGSQPPLRPVPPRDAQGGELPSLAELSPAFRAGLPVLHVNAHVYSGEPGRSFLILNGRKFHAGEETRAGVRIDRIVEDGVILTYRGTRFRMPL